MSPSEEGPKQQAEDREEEASTDSHKQALTIELLLPSSQANNFQKW